MVVGCWLLVVGGVLCHFCCSRNDFKFVKRFCLILDRLFETSILLKARKGYVLSALRLIGWCSNLFLVVMGLGF